MRPGLPPVRAVLFDLDGTLYSLGWLRVRLLARIPGEIGRHGLAGALRRFRAVQAFRRAREALRGSCVGGNLRANLVTRVVASSGLDRSIVEDAIEEYFYRSDFSELVGLGSPEDRTVLVELGTRGYRLGVLSEYPVEAKLERLGLGSLPWSVLLDCEQVGELKPSPAPFLEAARRFDSPAAEVLMVGDRRDADVAGARACGMPVAWLSGRDPGYGGGPEPDLEIGELGDLLAHLPGPTGS